MLLPSRADNDYRISVCHSQVLLPQFVCKEDTTHPYPHICDNIIADFPKISSSFQNTTLHSNKYDKISRYDTPGYLFPIPFLRSVHIFPSYCHLLKIYALLVHHIRVPFHMCSFSYIWQKKNPRLGILHTPYQIVFHRLR